MKSKTIRNIFVASTLVVAMGTAQAELSALQKQVLADNVKMNTMTVEQRREFRKQIFGNTDKVAQRAYNKAYKDMYVAGLVSEKSHTGNATSKAKVANRAVGTNITYDSGAPSSTNTGLPSQSVGNRFNSGWNPSAGASGAINPVLDTGSVTQITVSMGAVGGSAAFMTIVNGTSSGASVVSPSLPAAPGLNTIAFSTAITVNGPFMGAVWQPAGGTTASNDVVAVATGTVNGQGHHGVSFNDIAVTAITDLAGINAVYRVSGQLLQDTVPVELMNFEVE